MNERKQTMDAAKRRLFYYGLGGFVLCSALIFLGWTMAKLFYTSAAKPENTAFRPGQTMPRTSQPLLHETSPEVVASLPQATQLDWQEGDREVEHAWRNRKSLKLSVPDVAAQAQPLTAGIGEDWGLRGKAPEGATFVDYNQSGFTYTLPLQKGGVKAYWRMEFLPLVDTVPLYNLAHLAVQEDFLQQKLTAEGYRFTSSFEKVEFAGAAAGQKGPWLRWSADLKNEEGEHKLWQYAKESPDGGVYVFTLDLPADTSSAELASYETANLQALQTLQMEERRFGARLYDDERLNLQYFIMSDWKLNAPSAHPTKNRSGKPQPGSESVSARQDGQAVEDGPIAESLEQDWQLSNGKEFVLVRWVNRPEQVDTFVHLVDYVEAQSQHHTKGMQAKNTDRFEHRGVIFNLLKFAVRTKQIPLQADIANFSLGSDSYQFSLYGPYVEGDEIPPELALLIYSLRPLKP